MTANVPRTRGTLAGIAAVIVLAVASTVAIAAAAGGFGQRDGGAASGRSCAVPTLAGATVTVQLIDMRAMMRQGSMMSRPGSMMGQGDWRQFRHGMMRVTAAPASVGQGTVSLLADNTGYLTHELVVQPLAVGVPVGGRAAGPDGKVDESGSLGEASATCAAGTGDGITAGSSGWVTLTLPAGRYELICNLAGHYTAGMYTELDVT